MRCVQLLAMLSGIIALPMLGAGPPPTPPPPADVSPVGVIAAKSEPGQRLVISGRIFASDGVTPAAGVIVYAYHTDSSGEYHNDANRVARLHGWAKTDADGRFEFRTIRPAPYPGRQIAAHVHFHAWGRGVPLQWLDGLRFADDPLVSAADRASSLTHGKFGNVCAVTRTADGVEHVTVNFRLNMETNYPPPDRGDPRTRSGGLR